MTSPVSNLFGERKVKLYAIKDGKEYELGPITECDSLIGQEPRKTPCGFEFPMKYSMSFDLKPLERKQWLALGHQLGILKGRKTTYKTIKRNCAKRNIK